MNIYIHTLLLLLLTLVGCSKEPLDDIANLGDGQVRLGVELLGAYSSQELQTRAGDADVATSREKLASGTVFVFKSSDGQLQQTAPLQKDTQTGEYYAILEASTIGVVVKGVVNYDLSAIESKIDDKSLEIDDLQNNTYTTGNIVLKNLSDNSGLLPKSSPTLSLAKIDAVTVEGKELVIDFDYARIDVLLPLNGEEYPKLLEISAINAPQLPLSSTRIDQTHSVTPATNLEPYPSAISQEVAANKYIQGLYIYPTHTNYSFSQTDGVSVILKVQKSAELAATYYKIILRYSLGTSFVYDLRADFRYLVKVISITSDGYSSPQEAIDAPPGNIDYDIVIDDNSNYFVSNGQYYIGANKGEYWANVESYRSNMLYENPDEFAIYAHNDSSWAYNDNGTYSVDVAFTLGDGDSGNILPLLDGKVTLPTGASFDAETPLADDWKTIRTEQKYKINLDATFIEGDITIELGELTQTIKLTVDKGVVTDYTNKKIVEQLTGLPDGYGGVTGLRVANSYIAVPMSTQNTIFYIPVNDRIKEFWEEYASTPTSEYSITNRDWTLSSDYTVELSWYDGESIDGLVVKKAVSPQTNTSAYQNAIKVIIPKEFEHQNIVVNVRKNGTIIWSWHLWITDYNPYKTDSFNTPQRTGVNEIVPTIGGEIHSYDGTIWQNGGEYDSKLIMDRNLGAMDNTLLGHGGTTWQKGVLFYEFGRKDPFPGVSGKLEDGSAWVIGNESYPQSFEYAVNRPQTYVSGGYWSGQSVIVGSNVWLDKNVEFEVTDKAKSIFDPSPLGFRVADISAYAIFSTSNFVVQTNIGATYTPVAAFFPANSCREYITTQLNIARLNRTFIWASGGNTSNQARFFTYNTSENWIGVNYGVNTSWGFAVRPIQE